MKETWLHKRWWKILVVIFMLYTLIMGMLFTVPHLAILHETIRNLYFHVPMWFGMTLLLICAVVNSMLYLNKGKQEHDILASAFTKVALLFGCCGITTGMVWAQFTWGVWWNNDPKENAAAVGLLIYFAYFILRGSIDDIDRRARVGAVANIIFFFVFIPIIFIVPRLTDSLHPGNGGNPGFSAYDLDSNMRLVFYPAVLGWSGLGCWIVSVIARTEILKRKILFHHSNPAKSLDSSI